MKIKKIKNTNTSKKQQGNKNNKGNAEQNKGKKFFLRDGDIIAVKNIAQDPNNEDNFTSIMLPLTAKQSSLIAKPDSDKKKAARAPEIALKINVDDYENEFED